MSVKVTGINLISCRKPNTGGNVMLANVDFAANGFTIGGAILVRDVNRGLALWLPKFESGIGGRRAVNIIDRELRDEVISRAREAYIAIGGDPDDVPARKVREVVENAGEGDEADGLRRVLGAR